MGRRFRLWKRLCAVSWDVQMDKHVLVMIPGGAVVALAGAVPDRGQIEVRWNSQIVTVFVEDLLSDPRRFPSRMPGPRKLRTPTRGAEPARRFPARCNQHRAGITRSDPAYAGSAYAAL